MNRQPHRLVTGTALWLEWAGAAPSATTPTNSCVHIAKGCGRHDMDAIAVEWFIARPLLVDARKALLASLVLTGSECWQRCGERPADLSREAGRPSAYAGGQPWTPELCAFGVQSCSPRIPHEKVTAWLRPIKIPCQGAILTG